MQYESQGIMRYDMSSKNGFIRRDDMRKKKTCNFEQSRCVASICCYTSVNVISKIEELLLAKIESFISNDCFIFILTSAVSHR